MVRKGKVLLLVLFIGIMYFALLTLSKSQKGFFANIPMFLIVLRIILVVFALPYFMYLISVLFRVKMYTESTSTTISGQISSTGYVNATIIEGSDPSTASKFGLNDPSNHNKVFSYCFIFNIVLVGLLFIFGILPLNANNSGQSILSIIADHSIIMSIPFVSYFHNLIYVFIVLGLLILIGMPYFIAKKTYKLPILKYSNMVFLSLVLAGVIFYLPSFFAFFLK